MGRPRKEYSMNVRLTAEDLSEALEEMRHTVSIRGESLYCCVDGKLVGSVKVKHVCSAMEQSSKNGTAFEDEFFSIYSKIDSYCNVLTDSSPHKLYETKIPNQPGVYCIFVLDSDILTPLYAGTSIDLHHRIKSHKRTFAYINRDTLFLKYIAIPENMFRLLTEEKVIRHLAPKLNIAFNKQARHSAQQPLLAEG